MGELPLGQKAETVVTSPWEVGTVYLSASVESERTMVDLASLGLLAGQLLVTF